MTPTLCDKTGLIKESYAIEGITLEECRSIFLDWALKLPSEINAVDAILVLLDHYGPDHPDHPMTEVLKEGTVTPTQPKRRKRARGSQA